MRSAVIIDAVRTPIGRAHAEKGMYRDVRADDLSADLMKALLERVKVPGSAIEDVQWGCVKQEKEQGFDVARMAALIAGLGGLGIWGIVHHFRRERTPNRISAPEPTSPDA